MSLSLDLIIEVYVRLPVKSLICFKSVCKQWNSFICSVEFAKAHLQRAINNNNNNNDDNLFSVSPRNRLFTFSTEHLKVEQMKSTLKFKRNRYPYPIGSSNGLICFITFSRFGISNSLLYIWNPAIRRQYSMIEEPLLVRRSVPLYWGFGYDPLSDDYKIVYLGKSCYRRTHVATVYSLRTCQWRRVECPTYDELQELKSRRIYEIKPRFVPVLVGHTLYWRSNGSHHYILAFNLKTDSFEIIPLPTKTRNTDGRKLKRRSFFICRLRQCLCACRVSIALVANDDQVISRKKLRVEVSAMEYRGEDDDIVWKSLFTFERDISCIPDRRNVIPKLFELKQQGKYLIIYGKRMQYFVVDLKTEVESVITPEHVKDLRYKGNTGGVYTLDYTPSLVSPTRHLTSPVNKGRRVTRSHGSRSTRRRMA